MRLFCQDLISMFFVPVPSKFCARSHSHHNLRRTEGREVICLDRRKDISELSIHDSRKKLHTYGLVLDKAWNMRNTMCSKIKTSLPILISYSVFITHSSNKISNFEVRNGPRRVRQLWLLKHTSWQNFERQSSKMCKFSDPNFGVCSNIQILNCELTTTMSGSSMCACIFWKVLSRRKLRTDTNDFGVIFLWVRNLEPRTLEPWIVFTSRTWKSLAKLLKASLFGLRRLQTKKCHFNT